MPGQSADGAEDASSATLAEHHQHEVHGPIPWERVRCLRANLASERGHDHDDGDVGIAQFLVSDLLAGSRGASQDLSGRLTTLVLVPGAVAAFFGGWLTDWLVRTTGSRRWGRTAQAVVGAGISAFGILASVWTDSTMAASAFIALVAFGVQLQLPSWWAGATQVSGRHLGAHFRTHEHDGRTRPDSLAAICRQLRRLAKEPGLYRPRPVGPVTLSLRGDCPDRHGSLGLDQPGEDCGRQGTTGREI